MPVHHYSSAMSTRLVVLVELNLSDIVAQIVKDNE